MSSRFQRWQCRDTLVREETVSLRARCVSEVAENLVADLDQIRRVYRLTHVTDRDLENLRLDLLYFLADPVVAWVMYAFYSPEPAPDLGGHVMPAMWIYRLLETPDSARVERPPRPLEPPTWQAAPFDVFARWSPRLLRYPPLERARRLAGCALPWRPNDLTLIQVRQAGVDRIYGAGDLKVARSGYDVSHD